MTISKDSKNSTDEKGWVKRHKGPLVVGTAATLAVGAAYLAHPSARVSPVPRSLQPSEALVGVGDNQNPVNQERINAQYTQIFNLIRDAKKKADHDGKPLSIIVGEGHNNLDSFLAELMIMDAARKLGIKTAGIEKDAEEEKEFKASSNEMKRVRDQMVRDARSSEFTDLPIKQLAIQKVEAALIEDWVEGLRQKGVTDQILLQMLHLFCTLSDMTVKGFDPRHADANVIDDEIREQAMVKALREERDLMYAYLALGMLIDWLGTFVPKAGMRW